MSLILSRDSDRNEYFYGSFVCRALRVVMECSDRTNYENKLAIYVKCNWESENREWNCDYSASYTLVNRDADASFSNSILNRVLNFDHSLRGFHSFVKLTHLINEEKVCCSEKSDFYLIFSGFCYRRFNHN